MTSRVIIVRKGKASFSASQPRNKVGEWSATGGGGAPGGGLSGPSSTKGTGEAGTIKATTAKAFNTQVNKMYEDQDVTDWEEDYFDGLDAKQYFGTSESFTVNDSLRNGTKANARTKEASERVKKAYDRNGLNVAKGTKVHRAVSGPFEEQLKGMKKGESFTDDGWVSTSGTVGNTKRFGSTRMEITMKSNTKALINKNETEVLLPPGRKFTITGSRKSGKSTIITVEVD